jgi:hypothetical protein
VSRHLDFKEDLDATLPEEQPRFSLATWFSWTSVLGCCLCVPEAAARTLKRSVSSALGSSEDDSSAHDDASGVGNGWGVG